MEGLAQDSLWFPCSTTSSPVVKKARLVGFWDGYSQAFVTVIYSVTMATKTYQQSTWCYSGLDRCTIHLSSNCWKTSFSLVIVGIFPPVTWTIRRNSLFKDGRKKSLIWKYDPLSKILKKPEGINRLGKKPDQVTNQLTCEQYVIKINLTRIVEARWEDKQC